MKKLRKAKFGTVSVVERADHVRIRWRENGKVVERTKTSWQEACDLARQVEARIAAGGSGSPEGTFGGVADKAMARDEFEGWNEKAYQNLRSILRIHIIPALGSKKARTVSQEDCKAVLKQISDAGFSKHTVSKAKKVLRYIGNYGVKHGVWVAGQEPSANLRMPRGKNGVMDVQLRPVESWELPKESEANSLVATAWAMKALYGFIVEMARTCGLRWSEIRGLRPSDFDFAERVVFVKTSREPGEVKRPKTEAGVRRVVIAEDRVDVLKEFVDTCEDGEFIAQTETGNAITNSNWCVVMKRLRKKSGYPEHLALHSLRHYCGSKWRREGKIALEDISRMMGHANPSITQTLYLHSDPDYINRVKKAI
jgi:integrase